MAKLDDQQVKQYQGGLLRFLNVKNAPLLQGLIETISVHGNTKEDKHEEPALVITFSKLHVFFDDDWRNANLPTKYVVLTFPLRDMGLIKVNPEPELIPGQLTGSEILIYLGNSRIILYTAEATAMTSTQKL